MDDLHPIVRERLLFSLLLTGAAKQDPDFQNELHTLLGLNGNRFVMLLFSFDDFWDLPYGGNEAIPESSIFRYVESLKETITKQLDSHYGQIVSRYKNDVICIVDLGDSSADTDAGIHSVLRTFAEQVIQRIRQDTDYWVSTFVSTEYQELTATSQAYNETTCQRDIYSFTGNHGCVCFCGRDFVHGAKEDSKEWDRMEKEVLQLIRTRKFEKAKPALADYTSRRFCNIGTDINNYFFHVERFAYEIAQAFQSMFPPASEDLLQQLNLDTRFTSFDSISDLIGKFHDTIDQILSYEQENSPKYEWMKKLVKYIQENYTDPDLNASTVCDYFHKNPAYLSRVFRQEMGCGLYEYIQKLRIAKAQSLMEERHTLSEISQASGFASPYAMNRAFSKYEHSMPREQQEPRA